MHLDWVTMVFLLIKYADFNVIFFFEILHTRLKNRKKNHQKRCFFVSFGSSGIEKKENGVWLG